MTVEYLIAAIVGAIISRIASHDQETLRLRREALLEVVGYIDDVYMLAQRLHVEKQLDNTGQRRSLTQDKYREDNGRLTRLLLSRSVHAKVALAFGEGGELEMLNLLTDQILRAVRSLRTSTPSGWVTEGPEVERLFQNLIDPLRSDLHHALSNRTKLTPTFARWWTALQRTFWARRAAPVRPDEEQQP
jgi:hypothetical protein